MPHEQNMTDQICERLQTLGYEYHRRIRIYGEEFELISNPRVDGTGFVIEAISRKSGDSRILRIPLLILEMICKDLKGSASRKAA